MKVLLSIKPEFAKKIFDGTKKFEFRKMIFKNKNIDKIFVYVSSPVQRIIGEFDIESILKDSVNRIWEQTNYASGITEDIYRLYFTNKEIAYAIKIGNTFKYEHPKKLSEFNINFAPQSFVYITSKDSGRFLPRKGKINVAIRPSHPPRKK